MSNKTFTEQYNTLPPTKRDEIDLIIMRRCNVSLWTIRYAWVNDKRIPKESSQDILSEIFNTPKNKLFPEATN